MQDTSIICHSGIIINCFQAEDSAEVTAEELEDLGVVLPNAEESDHMWKSSSDR